MLLPASQQNYLGDLEDDNEELHSQLGDFGVSGEGSPDSRGSGGCIRDKAVKVIPCPRCKSMNTKFCYYNNYSVNQPRHFCRNCQRYWTVGGTLRNVPVGGGSRKKTRSRHRNDTYLRNGAPATSSGDSLSSPVHQQAFPDVGTMQQLSMLPPPQLGALGFGSQLPGFPSSTSQILPFLQYALEQNHAAYSQAVNTPMSSHQGAADLQSLFEARSANSGLSSEQASVLSGGYYVPQDVEPSPSEALAAAMHKAGVWPSPAQQLQSLTSNQTQAAWDERQFKPSMSSQLQLQSASEERRNQLNAAMLHHKPGFWETALMHSRPVPSERPGSRTWEEIQALRTNMSPHGSSTVEEEGTTPSNGLPHGLYEDAGSWGGLNPNEIYYQ